MPLAPHQDFVDKLIDEFNPPTYNYMLGPDILVAPITSDPAQVSVTFPQISTKSNGGDGGGGGGVDEKDTYVAWWNRSLTYRAGDTAEFHNVSLDVFTVFHRTGSLFPLRPAAMASHQPFSNKPCTDVLELHVYNPTATSPFPVQVVTNDDRPGLVAAYWRDPLAKSTGQHGLNSSGIHFTITAHPTLSVSIHVHFGHSGTGSSGDGRHPPAEEPLHPCTLHHGVNICRRNGNEQIKVCSKESRYVQHDMSARPGQLFPTHNLHHDPAMLEEQKPYLSCAGGYGDIVVPHGRIPHGVYLSVWMV
ncbi:uncharacterized protein LOC135825085 [Sycon ciliatum]|uniref:uncharacterized protein LOC135825085 n=1 Tax=Sycon ciliatum TaxID=27933 RepID=UPI0031F65602